MASKPVYATFWMRLLAHNIDLLFVLLPLYLISPFFESNIYLYSICVLYYLTFNVGFELSNWKGTPGKKALRIEVKGMENQQLNFFQVLSRNILKFLSLGLLFLGFAMINWTRRKQGLHDLIIGTTVIVISTEES